MSEIRNNLAAKVIKRNLKHTLILLFQEPDMMYKTREEQGQLLQQVLSASDMDADEERLPGEERRPIGVSNFTYDC